MKSESHPSCPPSVSAIPQASAGSRAALPRSVLFVALVIIAFAGLLALEISDSFVRHDGQIARSLFVLPVVLVLLRGLLTRRRWAWYAIRVVAFLAAVLYAGSSAGVWIFSSQLQVGLRVWISGVGLGLFALVVSAYTAMGRRPARDYFRV